MPLPHVGCVHTPCLQKPVVPQNVPLGSAVPAEQLYVVSLHVPCPAQLSAGVQSRGASVDTQLNVQSLLQPSPFAVFASSHSSVPVTKPSPHTPSVHCAFTQTLFVPQLAPLSSGVPAAQACPVLPLCVTLAQVSMPSHA